jgi:hypothetical protein
VEKCSISCSGRSRSGSYTNIWNSKTFVNGLPPGHLLQYMIQYMIRIGLENIEWKERKPEEEQKMVSLKRVLHLAPNIK